MIIQLEGNISSGKSTFGYILSNYLLSKGYDTIYINEPIDLWVNFNGINLLKHFYENMKQWCFTFQLYVLYTMLQIESQAEKQSKQNKIVIMERSAVGVIDIFSKLLLKQDILQKCEYDILKLYYNYSKPNCNENKLIIYLRNEPNICYERVFLRQRKEEVDFIDSSYIKLLHSVYEDRFSSKNTISERILIINGQSIEKDSVQNIKLLYPINCDFINELKKYLC